MATVITKQYVYDFATQEWVLDDVHEEQVVGETLAALKQFLGVEGERGTVEVVNPVYEDCIEEITIRCPIEDVKLTSDKEE